MVKRKFFINMGSFEYSCTECKYKVDSKTGLKLHTKKSHPNIELIYKKDDNQIFDCKFCETVFSCKKVLIKHLKVCKVKMF